MEQILSKDKRALLDRVIETSLPVKDADTLAKTGKRQLGVTYRIDNEIHVFTDAGWVHLFNVDADDTALTAAADSLLSLQGVLVAEAQRKRDELVKAMEGARIVDSLEVLNDPQFMIGVEPDLCVAIGSIHGDIYRYTRTSENEQTYQWALLRKGRDPAEEKALRDADHEMNLRAVDVSASTMTAIAPSMGEWATIMEPVDTTYPSMFDEQGVRLPDEQAKALHAQYLDTQRRVMLTKSAMITFGGNAKDGHEFTTAWLEQTVLQQMEIPVVPGEQDGVAHFTATVELPGIIAIITDSHYRTLLVRVAHFIATRHDPDTDKYVNDRLKEFANMPDPNEPKH